MGTGVVLIFVFMACSSPNAGHEGVMEQDGETGDSAADGGQQEPVLEDQAETEDDPSGTDDKGSPDHSTDEVNNGDRQDEKNQDGRRGNASDRTEQTRGKQSTAPSETVRPDDVPLTKKEAEELVRKHLELENQPEMHVQYDHDEQGRYVIQVYEVVGQGDTSHTATLGWYYVDPKTREIESMF